MNTKWKSYEEVARYLLNRFKEHFELEDVEEKQKVKGFRSGTEWEIDVKGWKDKSKGLFVIVECRRHTSSGQKQEDLAGLAYRIIDTGATSGIIVSPLQLQKGAKKVAQTEAIVEVTLNEGSTTTDYIMQFLNKIMIGVSEGVVVGDQIRVTTIDKNGNIKSDNKYK